MCADIQTLLIAVVIPRFVIAQRRPERKERSMREKMHLGDFWRPNSKAMS
jgi:hypothetical protein